MVGEWNAEQAIRLAYLSNVYVYACVHAIATDLSALPFRVGADPGKPMDFDVRDPLAQLLGPAPGGPNKNTSPQRLWAWTVAQRLVAGRWAWEIERVPGGGVAALWPLAASQFSPIASDGGDEYWKGYEYRVQGGQARALKLNQVVYDWVPSAGDWRQAESPLQAARLPISVAVSQDRYDVAFLRNDARPAAVVVHEAFEDTAGRDAWRRQFTDSHQGPDNAGKTAFIETTEDGVAPKDALFVQTLGLSQKDAEFIARYENAIRAIVVALGVPMSRLGDSSKRTFSNADQETINYWRNTVKPLFTELADAVNIKLAPQVSRNVGWFDISGVEALQDTKALTKVQPAPIPVYVRERIISRNEGRAMLGLPPTPGGDDLLLTPAAAGVALGNAAGTRTLSAAEIVQKVYIGVGVLITADEARAMVNDAGGALDLSTPYEAPPKPEPAALPFGAPLALPPAPEGADAANPRRGRSVRAPESAEDGKARRVALMRSTEARLTDLEGAWRKAFQALLNRQRDTTLSRLEGKRGRQMVREVTDTALPPNASQVFDRTFWIEETSTLVEGLYEQVVHVAGTAQVGSVGGDFKLTDSWVRTLIRQRVQKLSPQVTGTTYDGITKALADGVAQGEGIPELAARIRTLFEMTYKSRAETVARTEVISAYNGATHGAARGNHLVGGLEWIATLDSRTRPSHAALDGTIIGKGEAFHIDGATIMYPGDPNVTGVPDPGSYTINCRCTCAAVLVEDMPGADAAAAAAAA
jgi:HK97 family phage portal protein